MQWLIDVLTDQIIERLRDLTGYPQAEHATHERSRRPLVVGQSLQRIHLTLLLPSEALNGTGCRGSLRFGDSTHRSALRLLEFGGVLVIRRHGLHKELRQIEAIIVESLGQRLLDLLTELKQVRIRREEINTRGGEELRDRISHTRRNDATHLLDDSVGTETGDEAGHLLHKLLHRDRAVTYAIAQIAVKSEVENETVLRIHDLKLAVRAPVEVHGLGLVDKIHLAREWRLAGRRDVLNRPEERKILGFQRMRSGTEDLCMPFDEEYSVMILVDDELRTVVEILNRALPYDDTGITLELYDVENLHGIPFVHSSGQVKSYHYLVALVG